MLDFDYIEWDDVNTQHVAEHGITKGEVEDVLYSPVASLSKSRTTGRPTATGITSTGRTITVVFEQDDVMIRPITAYEIED